MRITLMAVAGVFIELGRELFLQKIIIIEIINRIAKVNKVTSKLENSNQAW